MHLPPWLVQRVLVCAMLHPFGEVFQPLAVLCELHQDGRTKGRQMGMGKEAAQIEGQLDKYVYL